MEDMTPEEQHAHEALIAKAKAFLERLKNGEALVVRSIIPQMPQHPVTMRARLDRLGFDIWGYQTLRIEQGHVVCEHNYRMSHDSDMIGSLMYVEEVPGGKPLAYGKGKQ